MNRKRIFMITPFVVLVLFFILFAAFGNKNNALQNSNKIGSTPQTVYSDSYGGFGSSNDGTTITGTQSSNAPLTAAKAAAAAKASAASAAAAKVTTTSETMNSSGTSFTSSSNSNGTQKSNKYLRKVILSGNLGIETTKFDAAIKEITEMTSSFGGFMASSNVTGVKADNGNYLENREANFVIRIPSSKFDAFVLNAGNLGVIVTKTSSGEDITAQYYDSTARLNSQKIKEARLLDILKKTKTLSDVLALETELENTRYQIENLTGTLKMWDDLVQFSTININLKEVTVKKPLVKKPVTLSDRIHSGFKNSINSLADTLKTLLVDLIAFLPYAAILIILMGIGYFIYRYIRMKK